MPLHDWSLVPAGLFHDFHQGWSIRITDALNTGLLPRGLSALVEQRSGPFAGDVLAIEERTNAFPEGLDGSVGTMDRPATRIIRRTANEFYSQRANRIVVRHHLGRIIAVIEIISPANKDSRAGMREFVNKVIDFLRAGIHVLVIDLFPPTSRDPQGLHKVIWDEILEEDFSFPPGQDRVLASYQVGDERAAYVETVGVGDPLPNMPLFLAGELYVWVPLEVTYQASWNVSSEGLRLAVEEGRQPDSDGGQEP